MSSDLHELKERYGIDCDDHEIIDRVLDEIEAQELAEEEQYLLSKGRQVHRIVLSTQTPAIVQSVELNIALDKDVALSKFNHLDNSDFKFAGAWFVSKEFIVRSKKEAGCWVQYAFKSDSASNLVRSEIIDYLNFSKLAFDVNQIPEFGPFVMCRE